MTEEAGGVVARGEAVEDVRRLGVGRLYTGPLELLDDDRRRDLSERGYQRSREFSLERVVSSYETLYRDVIRGRRKGSR